MSSPLLQKLIENPFVLAPMAGITDCAFRSFMREMGAGVVVTELVSATGLKYSSQKTKDLMKFEEQQRPIGVQIFGEELSHLSEAAKYVEDLGADFVDLNFGCPVPKVVKKGAGAATLRDLVYLGQVLKTVKSAVNIPVTIKVRTGWDSESRNTVEVAKVAYEEGITWVAIHGRTRAQGYSGQADWDYIKYVKDNSRLPILGNGDINNAKTANRRLVESNCDGVLIGRGCLKNPWIFKESLSMFKQDKSIQKDRNIIEVFNQLNSHLNRHFDERIVSLQLKKFAAWFSTGYPGASHFRKKIFTSSQLNEVLTNCEEYFQSISTLTQEDTSQEAFLMGGHG